MFNKTAIHWGICLPSSCTTKDAQIFTKEVFESATETLKVVSVEVNQDRCIYEKAQEITSPEIIYG